MWKKAWLRSWWWRKMILHWTQPLLIIATNSMSQPSRAAGIDFAFISSWFWMMCISKTPSLLAIAIADGISIAAKNKEEKADGYSSVADPDAGDSRSEDGHYRQASGIADDDRMNTYISILLSSFRVLKFSNHQNAPCSFRCISSYHRNFHFRGSGGS